MPLPTPYQQFIHTSRYARWMPEENRREGWDETVARYFDFFTTHLNETFDAGLTHDEVSPIVQTVTDLRAMPSMRAMMTAGNALARDNICGYNCAYRAIDDVRAFDEILFILMCGTGVGFSVERQYINILPAVPETMEPSDLTIVVRDSKRGWAEALRELFGLLYAGRIPNLDTSKLRSAGAVLKTMGGRSSGPGPLIELFAFVIQIFKEAIGRKLHSLECHDIICKIGDCVVVGGVRRSALISLSNLSDQRMRDAKAGEWWSLTPHRQLSNNSVAYTEVPEVGQYMEEWLALYHSKSGERGIFNRQAARLQAERNGRRKVDTGNGAGPVPIDFGTNPCGEIILRSQQFCNLTEIVVRADMSEDELMEAARAATIMGTWQATLTNFRYITKKWKDNCEEERLLGVSLTGMMDNEWFSGRGASGNKYMGEVLDWVKNDIVIPTNKEWANRLGVSQAAAITCVKPSGTISQLVDSASGIHARYARHYIRRVQQDKKDPVTAMLIDQGVPYENYEMNSETVVFAFPVEAPKGSVFRNDMSAIEQLEHWKVVRDKWCEHNPSITVYVREKEWPQVGGWVYDNFNGAGGLTFLPHTDHIYKQAPYEEITQEKYEQLDAEMPAEINWSALSKYETEDHTTATHELACTAGACEI